MASVPWFHRAGWLALALAVWLLSHPYRGIWHDARVYLVLGLQRLMPEAYAQDVWSAFGSQGGFSLFDEMYAALLLWAPPAAVAKALALAGGVVWVAGLLALAVKLLGWRGGVIAVCLVVILNPSYGLGASVLVTSESFATARPFAMGLALAGLAGWIAGQRALAVLTLATALILHPLMAMGAVACIAALALRDRFVLGLLVADLTALVLGAGAGLAPLAPMDPLWTNLVRHTSAIVLPEDIESLSLDRNLWPVAALLLAGRLAPTGRRRFYQAVALVTAWCLLIALVVGLHYPAVLMAQAQLWRVGWLATVVALLACFDVVTAQPAARRRAASLGLAFTYLATGSGLGSALLLTAYAALLLPPLAEACRALWASHGSKGFRRLVGTLITLGTCGLAWLHFGASEPVEIIWPALNVAIEAHPVLVYGFVPALAAWGIWQLAPHHRAMAAVALASVALLLWDQRSPSTRILEAGYLNDSDTLLRQLNIRRGEVVYWPGNDLGPWLTLGTAGYAQNVQGIGIVFSRHHAVTLHARLRTIRELTNDRMEPSDSNWSPWDLHAPFYHPSYLSSTAIRHLCSDPELDHIIQHQAAAGLPALRVELPGDQASRAVHVYHCAMLRNV
ncbi:hypothetical protein [Tepidimonas sp.]|uniref:hypothetical protein n=1 Tax=Tepidimonas sp. TaxID=2002775 RepID=UPI002FDF2EBB